MGKVDRRRPVSGWRKAGRTGLWLLGAAIALLALQVTVAYNPSFLFPHKLTQGSLTVHMRSEIPVEINPILEEAGRRLAKSELYDPQQQHHVYIINSFRLAHFLLWRNVYFGCNLPNGLTYIVMADVEQDKAYSELDGERDPVFVRTLTESIAHEVTHRLLRDRLGYNQDRALPVWIKEGYCEYIAEGRIVDPEVAISMYQRGQGAGLRGYSYFLDRLLVGYLIEERGQDVQALTDGSISFDESYAGLRGILDSDECSTFLAKLGIG